MIQRVEELNQVEEQLLRLLSEFVHIPVDPKSNLQLYRDLRLAGDDVDEFLNSVEKHFGLSMRDTEWSRYFPQEAAFMSLLLHWLGFRTDLHPDQYLPLSVGDLGKMVVEKSKRSM